MLEVIMRCLLFILVAMGSSSLLSAQSWSAWKPDPVFHGIQIREHCSGFNEFANRYVWDVELRNTYKKDVDMTWAAEPGLLHGAEAQIDHALAVKPGEVVEAHHIAPNVCSAGLLVKVNDVKAAGNQTGQRAGASSLRPRIQGRWKSKDPEPLQKELVVELSDRTVTSSWSSPNFSIQISSPLPEGVSGSVSLGPGEPK
jgi:hypothetical protein